MLKYITTEDLYVLSDGAGSCDTVTVPRHAQVFTPSAESSAGSRVLVCASVGVSYPYAYSAWETERRPLEPALEKSRASQPYMNNLGLSQHDRRPGATTPWANFSPCEERWAAAEERYALFETFAGDSDRLCVVGVGLDGRGRSEVSWKLISV